MGEKHTKGLRRGYVSNLHVDWNRRGVGGYSSITLINSKKRPVAVLLGDYVPGKTDADMGAAADLFCAAPNLLAALKEAVEIHEFREGTEPTPWLTKARAAISRATGEGAQ